MSAAWEADIPSGEKLVLIAMADQANHEGVCWPSIKTVARRCSKDERSVRRIIGKLIESGHMSRIVRPGTSNLWHIHPAGDKSDDLHRYIYKIEAPDGSYYLGRRASPYAPEADKYMGSGTWVQNELAAKTPLQKTVLSCHANDDELAEAEAVIIEAHYADPLCMNRRNEGAGKNDTGQNDQGSKRPAGRTKRPPKPSRTTNPYKKAIPANWWPDEFGSGTSSAAIVAAWSATEFQRQVEQFAAHHTAAGSKFVNWQAAWSKWVINSEKFKPKGRSYARQGNSNSNAADLARQALGQG